MLKILTFIRHNAIALAALFVALGGTSYAAFSLPPGSVGARQLKDHAITAVKLNPSSVAASVRAWATLAWDGVWRVQASSRDIHVTRIAAGEVVSWGHTRFARNCMASVTPVRNFPVAGGSSSLDGYVTTSFDGPVGHLEIEGLAANGMPQVQSVNVLIVCPTPGSQKVNR